MKLTPEPFSTFTNPLLPAGADPWAVHYDGWYYYTHTMFSNLTLWKTRDLTDLRAAESRVIWQPPAKTAYSKNMWAPEIHRIGGRWYMYFAADNGRNRNHRMYVLECRSQDPMRGPWVFRAQLVTPGDRWSIDGTVLQHHGELFLLWSGWDGAQNGRQNIYIARMTNPWTVEGERVCISTPTFDWELYGKIRKPRVDDKPVVHVNEGPSVLQRNGKIFVTFSASGCWTEYYALGLLWADASQADLLNPEAWHKKPEPVFRAFGAGAARTYAAGHNSFFQSPDGSEDWILYHANSRRSLGWGNRSPRAQKFQWTSDGFPCFGVPVSSGEKLLKPSNDGLDESLAA